MDREKRLNEARNAFEKFIAGHPLHWLAIDVHARLGNLLVDRGRLKIELGERFKRTPAEKSQLATEARALYQDAQKLFAVIDTELSEKLKEYKTIDNNDSKRLAERDQLRTDAIQARLALASVIYELARTYEPGSKENKENLAAAAVKYNEVFKKYSRWVGGYYGRVYEARCYQELGDYAKATTILGEVMAKQEYDEGFHRVRGVATVLALQTALLPQVKQYKEALEIYRNWEKNIAQRAEATEEALAIKCLSGEAALEYARSVKVDSLEAIKQRSALVQLARDLLTFTIHFPSEYRQRARVKLADPLLGGSRGKAAPAKSYDEARDRAKIAWEQLHQQDVKPEEEAPLRAEARQNFRFALMHAPSGAAVAELNDIRYHLAYLYWAAGDYYDAAVIGEFLARRYPNRLEAQQAAKLTLDAYAKLVGDAPSGDDRKLEKERMTGIAQFITERWPNSPAADDAWTMLIGVAINDRDLHKAIECLGHVSADSPRRGDAELRTGRTLWTAYLNAAHLPEAQRPAKAELNEMVMEAQRALEDGINRVRKPADAGGQVSPLLADSVLALAQICLDAGQPQKAFAWIDDPKIGPHTLVKANHKATEHGAFRVETLKATLWAYVGAQKSQKFDEFDETMDALEKAGGDLDLTQIYLNLGHQLEKSLKEIRVNNNPEEVARVVRGFTVAVDPSGRPPGERGKLRRLELGRGNVRWSGRQRGLGQQETVGRGGRLLPKGRQDLPHDPRGVPRRRRIRAAAGGNLRRSDSAGPLSPPLGTVRSGHRRAGRGPQGPKQLARVAARGRLYVPSVGRGETRRLSFRDQGRAARQAEGRIGRLPDLGLGRHRPEGAGQRGAARRFP